MNEYIEIAFRSNGRRLKVKRQLPDGQIEFEEPDPIRRSFALGLDGGSEATRLRLKWTRQRFGWKPGEFRLKVSAEDGYLVVRGVDRFALPQGRYRVRVHVEEAKTRKQPPTVSINEDGNAEAVVELELDDRQVVINLADLDPTIGAILDASTLDGRTGRAWLSSADRRPSRKACLLNLLASLASRPTLTAPLARFVRRFYHVASDRAYAEVDTSLLHQLEELARDARKPFYREGKPNAAIHLRLLESIPTARRTLFSTDRLISFRGEGSPSLQVVVAQPAPGGPTAYAEFDLDLGNALQDVVGFLVHMGELLDGKPTSHLDLHRKLVRNERTARFLYYELT